MKYLIWLVLVCLLVPVSGFAQSVPEQSTSNLTGKSGPWVQTDPAIDNILEAQKISKEFPPTDQFQTAADKLQVWMDEREWEKWDPDTKCLFVIGVASADFEDPALEKEFLSWRPILAMGAVLDAKRKIIDFIATKLSGKDQLITPGTDIKKQLGGDYDRVIRELETQRKKVTDLIKMVDKQTAEVLEGVTNEDRAQAAIAAAIKKLDETYSDANVEEGKKKKLEEIKKSFKAAYAEKLRLEKRAARLRGKLLQERTNMIGSLAEGPVFGAVVLNQAESWEKETGKYQVAVLTIWSPKMAREAEAFVTKENYQVKPVKGSTDMSVKQWLKTLDLSSAIGPRQYLDASGKRWLVGIGAQPIGKTSFSEEIGRGKAELQAKHAIAASIFADVYSSQKIITVARQLGTMDANSNQIAESFERNFSQEYNNMPLRGMLELTGRTYTHPISQQKIFVSVYGLNPDSSEAAYEMMVTNNAALMKYLVQQTYEKGREEARRLAIAGAKDDPTAFRKGLAKGTDELSKAIEGKSTGGYRGGDTWQPGSTPSGESQGGVPGGDEDVKDNFR